MECEGLRLGLVITVLSCVLSQNVSIVAFVNWLRPIIEIPLKRKIAKDIYICSVHSIRTSS